MAKIVYGVSGEGSGHSSRASEIIPFLLDQGHQVKVVSYDRGYNNLKNNFDVFETEGLHIASVDNKVSIVKTFTDNLMRLPEGHRALHLLKKTLFKEFGPDCVITDFEPMTAYLANHYNLPLITVDNQHRIRYMEFDCPLSLKKDQLITETIIRSMVPKPDVSLVTTFYFGKTTNDRTFLFPPILRKQVLDLPTSEADHFLVYLTSGFESFIEVLKGFNREKFVIYGYDKSLNEGNITYKPFSKDGFLKDLSSCRAVISTAGFTLLTEAIYLKKPYLALPMRGQFEQELNAIMLEQAGFGMNMRETGEEAISTFFYRLPDYKEKLMAFPSWDNSLIKKRLKELLDNNCAEAKEYHLKRTGAED
ncbi:MAG: glycosyltransferase family protein [Methanosarcina sp.]|nr:glycosyltransferase family protein [Methanosarcina sp.]